MDSQDLLAALKAQKITHQRIADELGIDRTAVTKMFSGKRKVQVDELNKLHRLLGEAEGAQTTRHATPLTEQHDEGTLGAYVSVVTMPTFAGMGGGGTGEGEVGTALVSRHLVEDELRGKPEDFVLIDVRGDSMEPRFYHGDQLLIDTRDRNPIQGGPFAIRFPEGYVVKNLELLSREQRVRVFSSNQEYREDTYGPDELEIIGRPVWFARRL